MFVSQRSNTCQGIVVNALSNLWGQYFWVWGC